MASALDLFRYSPVAAADHNDLEDSEASNEVILS
jgi:hypothetical protein